LDGTSTGSHVIVPHSSGLDGMDQLTLSLWVRKGTAASGGHLILKHITYRLQILNNQLEAYLFDKAGNRLNLVTPVNSLTDTAWHHITLTKDGTSLRLYIDGVQRAYLLSSAIPAVATHPDREVLIGEDPWGNAFLGDIDEVRLYDKALTSSEVLALAALTGPTPTPTVTQTPTPAPSNTPLPAKAPYVSLSLSLEQNLLDQSGNLNNGFWVGTANYGSGWTGYGIHLDGTSTGPYVVIPHASTLDGLDALTLSLWARKSTFNAGGFLIQKHLSYKLEILNNQLQAYLFDKSGTRYNLSTPVNSVSDTYWHHFALSQDSLSVKLYIDGVLRAFLSPGSITGTASNPDRSVVIGKDPWGNAFSGDIDEVNVYGRALTSSEIASIAKEVIKSRTLDLETVETQNGTSIEGDIPKKGPQIPRPEIPRDIQINSGVEAWNKNQ
jgi:hypothetical protein